MALQTFQQTLHKGVRFGYIEKFDWYDLADISTNPLQRCQFGSVGFNAACNSLSRDIVNKAVQAYTSNPFEVPGQTRKKFWSITM